MHKVYDINLDKKITSDYRTITFPLNKWGELKIKGIENINTMEIDYTKFRFKDFSLKNQNSNKYLFRKNGKLINNTNNSILNIDPIKVKGKNEGTYILDFNKNTMAKEKTRQGTYISIQNKIYKSKKNYSITQYDLVNRINDFIKSKLPETANKSFKDIESESVELMQRTFPIT